MTTATGVSADLVKLEEERCRALSQQDWPALDALLAADYTHTHTTGRLEGKAEYLEGMKARPRTTFRRDLSVRLYGDTAVMQGVQVNKSDRGDMESAVVQVWVKQPAGWKLVATQNTRLGG